MPAAAGEPADPCAEGPWEVLARGPDGVDPAGFGDGPFNDWIHAIAVDGDGRVYLATGDLHPVETHGGGLAVRHPDGRWEVVRMGAQGLASNSVYALAVTGDGVLVGTLKGVDRVRCGGGGPCRVEPLPRTPVPPYTLADVTDIELDSRGRAWFASGYGLFVRDADGRWDRHGTSSGHPGLESRFVTTVEEGPDGRIWAGTMGKGLAVLGDDGRWTAHRAAPGGLGNDYVHALAFDRDGRAWVGTGIGVSVLDEGGAAAGAGWTVYTPRDAPLPDEDVRAIAVGGDGRIWLGTHGGLVVVDGDRWQACDAPAGVAAPWRVIALAEAPAGDLWIGSYGQGAAVLRRRAP